MTEDKKTMSVLNGPGEGTWSVFAAKVVAERDEARAEVERLRGVTPELPPRAPDGHGLPRYGLRWSAANRPVSVPLDDGYWTPWHLASDAYRRGAEAMREACTGVAIRAKEWRADEYTAEEIADALRVLPIPEEP